MSGTRVVNLRAEPFDVYIGRAGHGEDGYFGNPCKRDEGLAAYRAIFLRRLVTDRDFKGRVEALRGKTLGCFCKPGPCHGDVIVEWLEATTDARAEDLEERAGILEFDAGLSRAQADEKARELAGPVRAP